MAMSKVRADVRAYVQKGVTNGMSHLGEYPKTMEDAVRTIIALQDLLEESMSKHQKATGHLMDSQRTNEVNMRFMNLLLAGAAQHQMDLTSELERMNGVIAQGYEENQELHRMVGVMQDRALQAENSLFDAEELRAAHQLVLKSTLNQDDCL